MLLLLRLRLLLLLLALLLELCAVVIREGPATPNLSHYTLPFGEM